MFLLGSQVRVAKLPERASLLALIACHGDGALIGEWRRIAARDTVVAEHAQHGQHATADQWGEKWLVTHHVRQAELGIKLPLHIVTKCGVVVHACA